MRPSELLNNALQGGHRHESIKLWLSFIVYSKARHIVSLRGKQARLEALDSVHDGIKEDVKREVERLWQKKHRGIQVKQQ